MIKGIVRNLDKLGRATLPKEYRRSLGMVAGEEVDIYLNGGGNLCTTPKQKRLTRNRKSNRQLGKNCPTKGILKIFKN